MQFDEAWKYGSVAQIDIARTPSAQRCYGPHCFDLAVGNKNGGVRVYIDSIEYTRRVQEHSRVF